jgi:LPS-assembly lipoprotein
MISWAFKHLGFLLVLITLSLLTTGCYWHLRNANEIPPQLKVIYLDAEFVESRFNMQLLDLLRSLRITLAPKPQAAPYTLHVFDYSLQHNNPVVSSTNVGITYVYTLAVSVSITGANGQIIVPPHQIRASRSVTVNTNQIFTVNSTSVFQQDLQREGINLIYYWLTSAQIRKRLNPPPKITGTTHATQPATTFPAP